MSSATLASEKYLVFALILALLAALPAANAVDIDYCGFEADAPGEYVVTTNLVDDTTPACITISADDVVVDCAGHTIQAVATPQAGVYASGVNNITVKNCVIQGFGIPGYGAGVKLYSVTNSSIENNVLTSNGDGLIIALQNPDFEGGEARPLQSLAYGGNVVKNNAVSNNGGYGILISGVDGNTLEGNTVNSNFYGVYLVDSSNNFLNSNTMNENQEGGIYIGTLPKASGFAVGSNTLSGNTVENNWQYGIELHYSDSNVLDGNLINGNCMLDTRAESMQGCYGLVMIRSNSNTIKNNEVKGNGDKGIMVFSSEGNVFENNVIESNYGHGIMISTPAFKKSFESLQQGNTFSGNSINHNYYGVIIEYESNNVFENNQIKFNQCGGVYSIASSTVFTDGEIKENKECGVLAGSDVILDQSSTLTLTSVDFNKDGVSFYDEDSALSVYWRANILVTNLGNEPVEGASVSVKDINSNEVYSGVTNAEGKIPTQTILEYVQTGAPEPSPTPTPVLNTISNVLATTNYTPHSFTATKNAFSNTVETQVTQDVNVVIQLPIEAAPPTISNVRVIDVTQNTVTIGWNTDKNANESVSYGTSASYGLVYSNAALATTHTAFISGLSAGTLYHYKIGACDAFANCAESSDYTFTTVGSSGGASGGGTGGGGLPGGREPSPTPTATPTESFVDLGDGASASASGNETWTVFKIKYVAKNAFDGFIEWELPIDCADYLNGIVYFTPNVASVTCGSIKAVWEVKFLKAGDEFNAKVAVRRQLPANAVNDVKTPKLIQRETKPTASAVATTLPTITANTQAEAVQPATGEIVAGSSSNYWLIGAIIAVAVIAAIAFYARKRNTAA